MNNYIEVTYLPDTTEPLTESPLEVRILPVKRSQYREVLDLCHLLLLELSRKNIFIGELLLPDNENFWGNINKLVELLPLSGGGKLDIDRVSDEDIIRIFLTSSTTKDEDGRLAAIRSDGTEGYGPSELARIHGFNFFTMLQKVSERHLEEQRTQNQEK